MLEVQVPSEPIHGEVEQGYGPVADAFRRNFAERGEIGAAAAVYRDGEKVVDLWGGYRDGVERLPWEPGTQHGYHGVTLGWYEGELLRRVDPDGRSLGRFFAEEIAATLGIEFHIGVPDDLEASRFATVHGSHPAEMLLHMHELPPRFVLAFLNPESLTGRAPARVRAAPGPLPRRVG